MLLGLGFNQNKPLKSHVESLSMNEVFQSLNRKYRVSIFQAFYNLLHTLGKDQLQRVIIIICNQRVFQLELSVIIVSNNNCISSYLILQRLWLFLLLIVVHWLNCHDIIWINTVCSIPQIWLILNLVSFMFMKDRWFFDRAFLITRWNEQITEAKVLFFIYLRH